MAGTAWTVFALKEKFGFALKPAPPCTPQKDPATAEHQIRNRNTKQPGQTPDTCLSIFYGKESLP